MSIATNHKRTAERAETTPAEGARRAAIAKRDAGLDLSPREVALVYAIRTQKVLAWIAAGDLEADDVAADLSKKPRWRIRASVLAAFFERRRQSRRNEPDAGQSGTESRVVDRSGNRPRPRRFA